ncbi:MAG: glutamate synthase large subunit [Microbacter sp.]
MTKQRRNQIAFPPMQGLYDPDYEKDGCGVGLVVNIKGGKSHDIVESGLQVLEHMMHRGAEGADNKTGDGAGILVQIPHEFILLQGIPVPEKGKYGTGLCFMPKDDLQQAIFLSMIRQQVEKEGLSILAIRDVPVNDHVLGEVAKNAEPDIKQLFIVGCDQPDKLERKLYVVRKRIEKALLHSDLKDKEQCYIVSLSTKKLIYKGMLSSIQLRSYFPDLTNPYFTSALALIHSRFSTNTFPTWSLAQPFRMLGHNGEINTIRGNRSWMQSRKSVLNPELLAPMEELDPIVQPGMSDSATLDNVLEFFVMSGMSIPHALAMLIPESFNDKNPISAELKAFYEYHSIFMEPWDGPATIIFSDGRFAGGMLDRNGLRPARYLITKNDVMVIASETGVLPFDASQIKEKGRLRPGKMLMVDTEEGIILRDPELKSALASAHPYKEWLEKNRVVLGSLSSGRQVKHSVDQYEVMLRVFGYNKEDIERIMIPLGMTGAEPTSSMGNDIPPAVMSTQPQRLFTYFRQQFAQVTNPAIDPIREELVMSTINYIGSIGGNILHPSPEHCKVVRLPVPVLTNTELDILCNLKYKGFTTKTLSMLFPVSEKQAGMEAAIHQLCMDAENAVDSGYNYIILSDKGVTAELAPIPSLLALSAVHTHLNNQCKRAQIALIVETAEAYETMHIALLIGFGASGVNPYMAFAVLNDLVSRKEIQLDFETAEKHYLKAIHKGLLKIMSKMGISTIKSYNGARIFEALGLSNRFLEKYFKGMHSKIEGADLEDITEEILRAHRNGFEYDADYDLLDSYGNYAYRVYGEVHAWNPETISKLQLATRLGSYKKFKEYSRLVDEKEHPIFLRDLMTYKRNPIDVSLVEPASEIMKRFVTGAMSFGSISREAHEALALAMNAIGGKSNTGEGGEDPDRFKPRPDGTSARSAIKQVASGRFGVTTHYLVNADEIQIKIAQGAKPGEGGQLPGFKVDEMIAKTRHSIPGISLISPPPHHDIYSIEDLAQLIFDLKNVNPKARISVKLVSESGVGTIAAGVVKAKADMILISGCEGGTGASPMSSIRHAGLPAELGLAETQQTLVLNNLRGNVRLQVDGQIKTGRDIVMMALLGAEEFGFATSALIVLGCVLMRKCHLNTCPMGVATQDEKLRQHFVGRYEYLVHFFTFLAEEVREHLAELGYTKLDDIIGRADLIQPKSMDHGSPKLRKIDLSQILYRPKEADLFPVRKMFEQKHKINDVLDLQLIEATKNAVETFIPVQLQYPIHNTDRAVGAMLSGRIAEQFGETGLPDGTINVLFAGSAGQSFGAFLVNGITFQLEGDANDYLGKGLSGGRIIVKPPLGSTFKSHENIIAGNTLLYGATSGEVYISGRVGERFCVRNSGAIAVVEGTGDHCCEYMTGGRTVVLGSVGRNFAAGMSGGIAYVWDPENNFDYFCNMEMVELSLVEEVADIKELTELIEAHVRYTDSPIAKELLENWEQSLTQFIKIMPIEYKKVLHAQRVAALEAKIATVERDY